MEFRHKADRISLFSISKPRMRAFHMTWLAFFLCFLAWFGIALLAVGTGEYWGWRIAVPDPASA